MPDVTIRFREGVITVEEAAARACVLAAPPPPEQSGDPVMYAFEPESDELERWAGQYGFADLLREAMDAVGRVDPGTVDQYALVEEIEKKSALVEQVADELATAGSTDPETLIGEATRRRVLETVTLYSAPFYQRPLAVLPASIPSVTWIMAIVPQVQSVHSTQEVALLYDQPNYGPARDKPRAVVWPGSGIPFLTFAVGSIFVN